MEDAAEAVLGFPALLVTTGSEIATIRDHLTLTADANANGTTNHGDEP